MIPVVLSVFLLALVWAVVFFLKLPLGIAIVVTLAVAAAWAAVLGWRRWRDRKAAREIEKSLHSQADAQAQSARPDQQAEIEAMQAEGVPAGGIYDSKIRDWHVYNYWEHILDKKAVARDGLPWSAVPAAELPRYSRDMCPRALDLLSRAIMLDVSWNYSPQECAAIALGINKVLRTILK